MVQFRVKIKKIHPQSYRHYLGKLFLKVNSENFYEVRLFFETVRLSGKKFDVWKKLNESERIHSIRQDTNGSIENIPLISYKCGTGKSVLYGMVYKFISGDRRRKSLYL